MCIFVPILQMIKNKKYRIMKNFITRMIGIAFITTLCVWNVAAQEDCNILLLTNPTAGGTVTGNGVYRYGDMVAILATPAPEFNFVNWTTEDGIAVSTNAHYTFTAASSLTLAANFAFAAPTCEITVSADPQQGGTVDGSGLYHNHDLVLVWATPAPDYTFVNWTENGVEVSTDAYYYFTPQGSRALVANFAAVAEP